MFNYIMSDMSAKYFPIRPNQTQSISSLLYEHQLLKISTQVGRDRRAYKQKSFFCLFKRQSVA